MPARGKGPLRLSIEDFLKTGPLNEVVADINEFFLERFERSAVDVLFHFVAPYIDDAELSSDVRLWLESIFNPTGQAGISALAGFGISAGQQAAGGLFSPLVKKLNYRVDRTAQSARFNPTEALIAARRMPEIAANLLDDARDLGWNADRLATWEELTRPILPEDRLIALHWRFPELRGDINNELIMRGWSDERIERLLETSIARPGVQDEILFSVREVYDRSIVDKFGLDLEFPTPFGERIAKLGADPDDAELYWMAHWQLPSVGLGYEMMHRLRDENSPNFFSPDDLDDLLKTQDFSPYWRGRLREISFNLMPRIDIRRLYARDIWDEAKILEANLDRGLTPQDAIDITEWTVLENVSGEIEVTRSIIERQYKRRAITRDVAIELLGAIGKNPVTAEFILDVVDMTIQEETIAEELDRIEFLFIEGEISETEVHTELNALGLAADQVTRRLQVWDIRRRKAVSLATQTELDDLYKRGIIELPTLSENLLKRRWTNERILWHLEKLDQLVEENAREEAEKKAEEQRKLEASELATSYQLDKAALDLEIALDKLAIADLKLALHDIEDTEVLIEVAFQIDSLKRDIAFLNVAKKDRAGMFIQEKLEGLR